MTQCPNFILDTDDEPVAPCGDEGRMCESCADAEYQRHAWMAGAVRAERESRQFYPEHPLPEPVDVLAYADLQRKKARES